MKKMLQYKNEIVKICKYLSYQGFMTANDGNISVRVDKEKILITPKQKNKKSLSIKDLVVIDFNGKVVEGKNTPSGEWRVHTYIYQTRNDVNAVIHTHPVYITAFAVAGISLDKPILPEVLINIGKIVLVEYATFYSKELAEKVKKFVVNHDVLMLRNHGLITVGKNLEEALIKTEKTEHLAKIVFIAKLLGKINFLSKKQIEELLKIKNLLS